MPIIIGNTNNQGNEIADSMARVADSIWGKGAQQAALLGAQTDVAKQQAYKLSDENTRRTAYFNALKSGDATSAAAVANAAASGDMAALAAAHLFRTATSQGATAPATQAAQVAAGQSYGNTYGDAAMKDATARRGQTFVLEGTKYTADTSAAASRYGHDTSAQAQRDVANINNDRAITAGIGPDGRPTFARNSDAARGAITPMVTAEQAKGALIAPYTPLGQPQQPPQRPVLQGPSFDINGPLAPPATMAAPTARDLTNTVQRPQPTVLGAQPGGQHTMLPPNAPLGVQEAVGEKFTNIPMIEPGGARRQGVSRDGGATVTLADGTTVPANGFMPAGQESAIAQGRLGSIVSGDQTWMQKNPQASPEKSGAMKAILTLGGPQQFGTNEVNRLLGATGLSKIITPLVGKDIAAAQTNLNVWNEQMIKGLGVSGEPGIKEQRRIYENLLPDDSFLSNPAVQAMKIPALANALVQRNEVLHKQMANIADPSSPMLGKLQQDIAENEKALDMLTNPNWGSQPFDVATSPGNALEAQAGRAGNNPDGTPRQVRPTITMPDGSKQQLSDDGTRWEPMGAR